MRSDINIADLERKYKAGIISVEDFTVLRDGLLSDSDESVAIRMERSWIDGDFPEAGPVSVKKLHRRIGRKRAASRILLAVAAAMIPLCIGISGHFIHKSTVQSEQMVIVSTAKGEQSTVTLPDGTSVRLNSNSRLTYSPGSFSGSCRHVDFDGEAFFEVVHDEDKPFAINTDQMNVKVTGTRFNLLSRVGEALNTLLLIDGEVVLESARTGETVVVKPGQKAVLEKSSSIFKITAEERPERLTAWQRKELTAINIPLSEVLSMVEDAYDVTIGYDGHVKDTDLFTGTLPSNNLPVCLAIIERAYGLRLRVSSDTN